MIAARTEREPAPRMVRIDAFEEIAEVTTVGGDSPFLLDSEDVWMVRRGLLDVFAVPPDAATRSRRLHVLRVCPNGAAFGIPPSASTPECALLAVPAADTELLRVPMASLRALAKRASHVDAVCMLVEAWVESLYAVMTREATPVRGAVELVEEGTVQLAPGAVASPRSGVLWITQADGASLVLGREALRVEPGTLVPLSRHGWLSAAGSSRLAIAATATLLGTEGLWTALRALHGIALHDAAAMTHEVERAERARLARRTAADDATMRETCARLASALTSGDTRSAWARHGRSTAASAATPPPRIAYLEEACQLVGDAMGLSISPAARAGQGTDQAEETGEAIEAIARASHVRTRKVLLREDWWQQDGGPLLAFSQEDERPVALLPIRSSRYVLHDVTRGETALVTAAVAATLAPVAYTFHRPLPEQPLAFGGLLRFAAHGRSRDMITLVVVSVAIALLGMLPPVATGMVYNTFIPQAERAQLLQMTLVLISVAVCGLLLEVTRIAAVLRLESRMADAVQVGIWDRLLALPMSFFQPYTAGELATRAMGIDAIRQAISGSAVTALISGVSSLGTYALLFYYDIRLALWATLLLAIAIGTTFVGGLLQLPHVRGSTHIQSRLSGLMLQLLSSIAKLRTAGAEVQAYARWAEGFARQRQLQYRARAIGNVVAAINAMLPTVASMVIFWSAFSLVGERRLRTGDMVAFMAAFIACLGGLLLLTNAVLTLLSVVPVYGQTRPILVATPEVNAGKVAPAELTGDIDIQHARFRYSADGPMVLRDLTLHVHPGEFVGLVGATGSGKSTLLRLLLGFAELETGGIYYDGQDINGLDLQAVRRQIGVVLQSGRLLAGDIFTNIVGSAPLTMQDAWEAAEMAGLADDVRRMPMQMHTLVSEGGSTLAGGQRQRLLIARALVRRPRIVFFDEATSALDNRTQGIVTESLSQLLATRIVIAHRLSTIARADRIHVLEHGRMVQSGSYDELLTSRGPFAVLAKRQLI
jgi:NHLM bacteriocin system ABC transporter ATP-binding protein